MASTRAFKSGNGQAVRIPAEIAFEDGQELTIARHGDVVTISPRREGLRRVLEDLLAAPPLSRSKPPERMTLPDRERG